MTAPWVPVRSPRPSVSAFREALTQQGAHEWVARTRGVVVGAGTVDYAIDEHRLDVIAAASAPAHADLLAGELEFDDTAGVNMELLVTLQLIEFRQCLLGKPVPVDVPVRTGVAQESFSLAMGRHCHRKGASSGRK